MEMADEGIFTDMRRCIKCILPETFPGIEFDANGVCNYCLDYEQVKVYGEEELADHRESKLKELNLKNVKVIDRVISREETNSGIVVRPGDCDAVAKSVIFLKENPDVARTVIDVVAEIVKTIREELKTYVSELSS